MLRGRNRIWLHVSTVSSHSTVSCESQDPCMQKCSQKWEKDWKMVKNQCILPFVTRNCSVCMYVCMHMHTYVCLYVVIEYREQHCSTFLHWCHPLVGEHHTPLRRHTLSGWLHQHLWRERERGRCWEVEGGGESDVFSAASVPTWLLCYWLKDLGRGCHDSAAASSCQSCVFLLSISLSVPSILPGSEWCGCISADQNSLTHSWYERTWVCCHFC